MCALLIGIAALIGVYSIRQQLDPDNAVPAEEIEKEKVVEFLTMSVTLQPIQP